MFRALVTGTAQALMHRKGAEGYLVFGGGQSEPYSWTCIPKKHTSTPSISSKANSALVRYGKDSDISPESTNLEQRAFCLHASPSTQTRLAVLIHVVQANCRWDQPFGPLARAVQSCNPTLCDSLTRTGIPPPLKSAGR